MAVLTYAYSFGLLLSISHRTCALVNQLHDFTKYCTYSDDEHGSGICDFFPLSCVCVCPIDCNVYA